VKEVAPSSVRVIWKDEEGRALRNYGAAARYLEAGGLEVEHAVQSGPLVSRRGKTHPAFREGSASGLHRNGVGVAKDGRIVLVMTVIGSDKHPNLYEFVQVFLGLGCEDALFLDGDLSEMRWGERLGRPGKQLGSFFAVVRERLVE